MLQDVDAATLHGIAAHAPQLKRDFLALIDTLETPAWSTVSSSSGKTIKKRSFPSSSWDQYIVIATLPHRASAIFDFCGDIPNRTSWDKMVTLWAELLRIDELPVADDDSSAEDEVYYGGLMTSRSAAVLGGMIAAREYVDFRIVVRNEGKGRYYSAWQAVEEGVGKKLLPESEGGREGVQFCKRLHVRKHRRRLAGQGVLHDSLRPARDHVAVGGQQGPVLHPRLVCCRHCKADGHEGKVSEGKEAANRVKMSQNDGRRGRNRLKQQGYKALFAALLQQGPNVKLYRSLNKALGRSDSTRG
ncbi:hypothetical protein DFJ73DRAFT_99923 [Zopfochytrium polystomum]|nr:hypothetical protein DFJ73DRAFT_99923 [Zopfochytrium polystomum]